MAGFDCIDRDITELHLAQEAQTYVAEIYRKAISNAKGVPYYLNYTTNKYEFVGENVVNILNVPAKNFTPTVMRKLVIEDSSINGENIKNLIKYGEEFRSGLKDTYQVDFKVQLSDGSMKGITDNAIPVKDEQSGKVIGSLGILQDITDRKLAEKEIETLNMQLERKVKNRTKDLENRIAEVEQLNAAMINLSDDLKKTNDNLERKTILLKYTNDELESFAYSVSHDL